MEAAPVEEKTEAELYQDDKKRDDALESFLKDIGESFAEKNRKGQ